MSDLIKKTKKSKFSKVIWYVDDEDEKEIIKITGSRADFIFVKTIPEFEKQIKPNSYLVFSAEKNNDSDELIKLIHSHKDYIFHELFKTGRVQITKTHALSRLEQNIKQGMWLNDILAEING